MQNRKCFFLLPSEVTPLGHSASPSGNSSVLCSKLATLLIQRPDKCKQQLTFNQQIWKDEKPQCEAQRQYFKLNPPPKQESLLGNPLQAPVSTTTSRPFMQTSEWQGGSWSSVWPPRLALLHLQDTAGTAFLGLAGTSISVKLIELGETARNCFSSYHTKHELLHNK